MKTIKPAIFLDFDGLKFDTLQMHVDYLNQRYGIESKPSDYIGNPSIDAVLKRYIPEDKHNAIVWEEVYLDIGENLNAKVEWHKDVSPLEGMCEVLPRLATKYDLWTITARQKTSMPVIEHLIAKHIPNCIIGIHCVSEHLGNNKFKDMPKRDFVSRYIGEKVAFIDDSPTEIINMQDLIPSYLFDPLGHHDEKKEIKLRVRSWQEIGQLFL